MRSAGVCEGRGYRRVWVLGGRLYGRGGGCDQSLKQLDLIERSLGVSWSGLDDFESNMAVESAMSAVSMITSP